MTSARRTGAVAAVTGVLLAGCGGGGTTAPSSAPTHKPSSTVASPAPRPTASRSASPAASPIDSATADPTTSPTAAPLVPVTGFGARLSVWATHHTPDERFDPGAMWDPTPGWGPDEANNDKYNELVLTGERVLGYVLYLPRPSVTEAKATAAALVALPSDVVVLWRKRLPGCSVVQLRSPSLAQVLAAPPYSDPQGQVQLVLRSGTGTAPSTTYSPTAVASVVVRSKVATAPADVGGC